MNTKFPPSPAESFGMCRNEIDEQDGPDEMAARENGNPESPTLRWPPYKEALEITLLGCMNSEVNLRECPGENQHHGRRQADDRQLQRCQQINESAPHLKSGVKINRLKEVEEFRLLILKRRDWSAHFKEPASSITPGPSRDDTRTATRHVQRGKLAVTATHRPNEVGNFFVIDRSKTDLFAPAIDVIDVGSAIAGKSHNRYVHFAAVWRGRIKTGESHRGGRHFRPTVGRFPFN